MATKTLVLESDKIGEVFTPVLWAKWLISRWNVFESWLEGKTICDPTAGTGAFAIAFIETAKERNTEITDEMLSRLYMVELQEKNLNILRKKLKSQHGLCLPQSNIILRDIILKPLEYKFDILIGNPPWANFTDLPQNYKEVLKHYFIEYGLVPNRQAALLGASRTDIAALVLKIVFHKMLKNNSDAFFFTPLSLFTGDDAHMGFRDYQSKTSQFSVKEIFEFCGEKVFEGIGTAYCACHFHKGSKQKFPLPYFRGGKENYSSLQALPLKAPSDPLRVVSLNAPQKLNVEVFIKAKQKPRQGVNPCGASKVFIFDAKPEYLDDQYLFPLASKEIWRKENTKPLKWVFLPYDRMKGKPLNKVKIKTIKGFDYLCSCKKELENRKGTLIKNFIDKGIWWFLLGVGPYSFAPYKVIWEAYGKHSFLPKVLGSLNGQPWQGNQAMHAFIPCENLDDANRICRELQCPHISRLLVELNGQGKCNFAQPGKIKKILNFSKEKL